MAFLGLAVPAATARILSEIDFGNLGDKEPSSSLHITMLYLGKEVEIEKIATMLAPIVQVVSQTNPFTVSISRVTTFPPNPDDGVPIIAPVVSNELMALRASICGAFDAAKIEYSKKYPDYKPHVTLGYSQDPAVNYDNAIDMQIPVVEWGAHEITLWGGDNGDTRVVVTFPLSVVSNTKTASMAPDRRTALNRAYVQLVKNWPTPRA
jgi:2'-5' RNA ligase